MNQQQSPEDRLYAIVEQGLCLGCGLCQAIAGSDAVVVDRIDGGDLRPVVTGDLTHSVVDQIYDSCPGTRVDGLPDDNIADDTKHDNVWGPWRRMVLGWAGDPDVRHIGSTGGVLSALGQFLISSGRVEFILHAKASVKNPTFGEAHLSFSVDDIMAGAGSRYGPTNVLVNINDVLDRGQPFAFIGKPCDIAALRNHARYDERVDQLVKYWLTPVCGGFMQPAGMSGFLERSNIDEAALTKVRYRGYGNPGPTRIEAGANVTELHYLDMWGEDESSWHLSFRCKICPDGIGEAADIAASDTWVGGSPNRIDSETDLGDNGIVVRSQAGQELLDAAIDAGAIVVGRDITPDEMSHYQPHQMRKKYAAAARHDGIRDAGQVAPVTHRLRIAELAAELPESHSDYQRRGTYERVMAGKATEPRPKAKKR